jgi:ABC-type sugar transport system ATPase subunit
MKVKLDKLQKKWGDVVGADDISLEIDDGEFVAFLGPSGCGKTTTLLMVAGIYKPTGGTIDFDGRIVNEVPPKDRHIGMVFQSYALYPHMSVFGNISYPLRIQKINKTEMQERVQRVADMMGIGDLLDRKPGQLSGGQQQRVSLGRALVKEPELLLFDEPLSNLDARLRLTMRGELKRLQKDMGITSIYVTHDQVEAMTMADRIAVMSAGILQAFDKPDDLYDRPKTLFVAGFVGNPPMNFMDVEVTRDNGVFRARSDTVDLVVPADRGEPAAAHGGTVILGLRPEDITLATAGSAGGGKTASGEALAVEPLGREDLVVVEIGTAEVRLLVDNAVGVRVGDNVDLELNTEKVQFFDPDTEHSLLWS